MVTPDYDPESIGSKYRYYYTKSKESYKNKTNSRKNNLTKALLYAIFRQDFEDKHSNLGRKMAINHFVPERIDIEQAKLTLIGFDDIINQVFITKNSAQILREAKLGDGILNLILDECVAKFARDTGFLNAISDKRKSNKYLQRIGELIGFDTIYPYQLKNKNATCFECLVFHLYSTYGYDKLRDFIIHIILQDNSQKIYQSNLRSSLNHLNVVGTSMAKFALLYYLYHFYGLVGFKTKSFSAVMNRTLNNLRKNRTAWATQLIQSSGIESQIQKSANNQLGSVVEYGLYFILRGEVRAVSLFAQYIDMRIEYQIPKASVCSYIVPCY